MVPSAPLSKGLALPVGDSAGVFEKHMNMKMSLKQSTPPVTTIEERRLPSSRLARCAADSDEPQAASTVQLVPPKLKRLAMRPETTLPKRPGKEFSCHGT